MCRECVAALSLAWQFVQCYLYRAFQTQHSKAGRRRQRRPVSLRSCRAIFFASPSPLGRSLGRDQRLFPDAHLAGGLALLLELVVHATRDLVVSTEAVD